MFDKLYGETDEIQLDKFVKSLVSNDGLEKHLKTNFDAKLTILEDKAILDAPSVNLGKA